MSKAFSYLRVSGRAQIDGDGFPRQRAAIKNFSESKGFDIVREFRDEGVSGRKSMFDREGLTELFVALKANGIRTVIVERQDRLARDLMISEVILSECRKLEVQVFSADSGMDLTVADDDPTRTLIRQILAIMAQWERSVIVQKLRAARVRARKARGKCEGRKGFGEKSEHVPVLDRIKVLKLTGLSNAKIAALLNSEGINSASPKRKGRKTKWHATTIQRILRRTRLDSN